ncbi:hypothetical protein [Ellagibacter isourolithinifaciens]|uniref:hypothetical protein n=1 Tax=Ellagibacter isourolithinifaciens TaxID=2137581 RepID=UPI003FD71455
MNDISRAGISTFTSLLAGALFSAFSFNWAAKAVEQGDLPQLAAWSIACLAVGAACGVVVGSQVMGKRNEELEAKLDKSEDRVRNLEIAIEVSKATRIPSVTINNGADESRAKEIAEQVVSDKVQEIPIDELNGIIADKKPNGTWKANMFNVSCLRPLVAKALVKFLDGDFEACECKDEIVASNAAHEGIVWMDDLFFNGQVVEASTKFRVDPEWAEFIKQPDVAEEVRRVADAMPE